MSTPAVHISEIKGYLRCKLAWYWSAPPPRGLGLEPIISRPALHFGRLIHEALQIGYDTGVPFADAYKRIAQEALAEMSPTSEYLSEIQKQVSLGMAMLQGYQSWAAEADKEVRFLALETPWQGVRLGRIPLAGRFDAIVERPDGLWVLDFKTTKFATTDWTAQDLQATAYVYAARQIYERKVRGLIFRFLLKKKPWTFSELLLKDGTPTRRKGLSGLTTLREYSLALAVATMKDLAENDAVFREQARVFSDAPLNVYAKLLLDTKHDQTTWYSQFKEEYTQARRLYHQQLQSLKGPSHFFWEVEEFRTEAQIRMCIKHVLQPAAKRIVSRRRGKWVGPTGLGAAFAVCRTCAFTEPCQLVMAGADYKSTLRSEYQLRDIYRPKKEVNSGT